MSLLVVGSVAYDLIEYPNEVPIRLLGGAATYACGSASLFSRPAVIGVVGDDFTSEDMAFFRERDIDTRGLLRLSGKTFFWHGRYSPDRTKRQSLATELGVFARFDPMIPPDLDKPDFLLLGNIHPTLQRQVLDRVKKKPFVGLDTIECWIRNDFSVLSALMPCVDMMFVNEEEAIAISQETNLSSAGKKILDMGAKSVVCKLGPYGCALFTTEGIRLFPGYPVDRVVDTTGAGDTFAGAVMGFLDMVQKTDFEILVCAMVIGTVVASFKVEEKGPWFVRKLTREILRIRLLEYARMVSFDVQLLFSMI